MLFFKTFLNDRNLKRVNFYCLFWISDLGLDFSQPYPFILKNNSQSRNFEIYFISKFLNTVKDVQNEYFPFDE
jgi:hypothetical protein